MRPFTTAGARIGVLLGLLASASAVPGAATAAPMAETVLVKVAPGADAGDRAAISRRLGAESVRALPAGWRAYRVGEDITRAQAARVVAGLPAESVELDQRVELAAIPDDPFFPYQRHLAQIGAPRAWDLAAAAGTPAVPVTVAVIDSGLDTGHPDIAGRLWVNAAERDGMPNRDDDDNGIVDDIHGANLVDVPYNGDVAAARSTSTSHGTHVAGLIGAATGNGTGIAGVAPTSRILTVRFLSGGSGGGLAKAIQGIEYARRAGARVINMSWTLTPGATSQALCDAVAEAGRNGIVMVAAAGNDGQDLDRTPAQPASCPSPAVIAVAATDGADDELSAFSNTGAATVDLAAPGTEPPTFIGDDTTPGLLSLYPSSPGRALYVRTLGTSMAAPLVAARRPLMLGARPGLTPEHVGALAAVHRRAAPGLAATTLSGRRLDLGAGRRRLKSRRCSPMPSSRGAAEAGCSAPGHRTSAVQLERLDARPNRVPGAGGRPGRGGRAGLRPRRDAGRGPSPYGMHTLALAGHRGAGRPGAAAVIDTTPPDRPRRGRDGDTRGPAAGVEPPGGRHVRRGGRARGARRGHRRRTRARLHRAHAAAGRPGRHREHRRHRHRPGRQREPDGDRRHRHGVRPPSRRAPRPRRRPRAPAAPGSSGSRRRPTRADTRCGPTAGAHGRSSPAAGSGRGPAPSPCACRGP